MQRARTLIEAVDDWPARSYEETWSARDVITYAVATGADLSDLPLLWERAPLQVLPTFGTRLGGRAVIDLHASLADLRLPSVASWMSVEAVGPLPPVQQAAIAQADAHVVEARADRVIVSVEAATEVAGQALSRTTTHVHFRLPRRGDMPRSPRPAEDAVAWVHEVPETVRPYQSATFRLLLGVSPERDLNDAFHIDPVTARESGFGPPVLQGEVTLGMVCRHAVRLFGDGDATRIRSVSGHMTGPVTLTDDLTIRFTDPEEDRVSFAVWNGAGRKAVSDGVIAIDAGDGA